MLDFPAWDICGIIAIAFVAVSFMRRRSATWAGLLIGFVIGLIIALIYFMNDRIEFDWSIVKKACIIATFAGGFIDILKSIISPRRKRV